MWTLTHTAKGLQFAYALVFIPMIVGLFRGHASIFRYIQALWSALVITVVCVIIMFLVSQFLHDMHVKGGVLQFLVAVAVFAGWGYLYGRGTAYSDGTGGGHQRGAVVSIIRPGRKRWWSRRARAGGCRVAPHDAPITLAGIRVAAADETKHFKFIGTTGTGKSTAIREMLSAALAR